MPQAPNTGIAVGKEGEQNPAAADLFEVLKKSFIWCPLLVLVRVGKSQRKWDEEESWRIAFSFPPQLKSGRSSSTLKVLLRGEQDDSLVIEQLYPNKVHMNNGVKLWWGIHYSLTLRERSVSTQYLMPFDANKIIVNNTEHWKKIAHYIPGA